MARSVAFMFVMDALSAKGECVIAPLRVPLTDESVAKESKELEAEFAAQGLVTTDPEGPLEADPPKAAPMVKKAKKSHHKAKK